MKKTPFSVPGGNFCQWKRLAGTVLNISENLRVKSEGHQVTKYGQKCSFGAITIFYSPFYKCWAAIAH